MSEAERDLAVRDSAAVTESDPVGVCTGAENELEWTFVCVTSLVGVISDQLCVWLALSEIDVVAVCCGVPLGVRLGLLVVVTVAVGADFVTVNSVERDWLPVRWPRVDESVPVPRVTLNDLDSDGEPVADVGAVKECDADRLDCVDDGSLDTVSVAVKVVETVAEFVSDHSALRVNDAVGVILAVAVSSNHDGDTVTDFVVSVADSVTAAVKEAVIERVRVGDAKLLLPVENEAVAEMISAENELEIAVV